jgi:hypothetical protein
MSARTARSPKQAAPVASAPLAPSAFAPQKSRATEKDLVLFELERARVAVRAAVQGMGAASAERPLAPGKWNTRQVVLHLALRDRARLDEFEALLSGAAHSWADHDAARVNADNASHLAPLASTPWDEALRLMEVTRSALMERLTAVPAEPAVRWSDAHAFGRCMRLLVPHDRGHAEQVKNARMAG